jgi:hypothetical protein
MKASKNNRKRLYRFNVTWEDEFCTIEYKGKCLCLICDFTFTAMKRHNVERHYKTNHSKFNEEYPPNSQLRCNKIKLLKSNLLHQQGILTRSAQISKQATIASFKIVHLLVKNKKPFIDAELFKEAFLVGADSLFEGYVNKKEVISAISNLQLSARTVARRLEEMGTDMKMQLKLDIDMCFGFSLQLDESTDICDTSQLSIIIRMAFHDAPVKEELLKVLALEGRTRGEDIYHLFRTYIKEINMPIQKLCSITTDGAPSMTGKHNGFISLCQKDNFFPSFISYHCIIHQEALCCKVLKFKHVMDIVTKTINSIRTSSLQHRLFKALVEAADTKDKDLLLHAEVRWLSRGKVLLRFVSLLDEMKEFLRSKNEDIKELNQRSWLIDLGFLSDITQKLNSLNLELQGKGKHVVDMISCVNAFKSKLLFWKENIQKNCYAHFPQMVKFIGSVPFDASQYIRHIEILYAEFEIRFEQFAKIEPIVTFLLTPFESIEVTEIAQKICTIFKLTAEKQYIEEEIINLQSNLILKSERKNQNFWRLVDEKIYPNLKTTAMKIESFFGSTYLCETLFSSMAVIKNKYRSRLTDDNLDNCLRVASSSYIPNYAKLVDDMDELHLSSSKTQ